MQKALHNFSAKNIIAIDCVSTVRLNEAWPRGSKTFFMFSSVENEILNAHQYKNFKKFGFVLGSDKSRIVRNFLRHLEWCVNATGFPHATSFKKKGADRKC